MKGFGVQVIWVPGLFEILVIRVPGYSSSSSSSSLLLSSLELSDTNVYEP